MKKFISKIKEVSEKIYDELGTINEDSIQVALSIELAKLNISHLRETTIQVYYDGHPLGRFELDFLITPNNDLKEHVIIEVKVAPKISDKHRQQLRNYLKSAPMNNLELLKKINKGIILNFTDTEKYKDGTNQIPKEKVNLEIWEFKNAKLNRLD
tara:strand:- start:50 stop:514 length:465 start_codon:yes stop_codon:yes gene_type:complete